MNEELETAKEELQASNEEMATINDELRLRNGELKGLAEDMANVLANVTFPIIIVDAEMRVRKFTPAAEKSLALAAGDVGRRIVDINLGLEVPALERALQDVIDDVGIKQIEVQDRHGRWISVWIKPYRATDRKIEGAVLAFVDISEQKQAVIALKEAKEAREKEIAARLEGEERFHLFVEAVKDYAIFTLDPQGIISTWNVGAQRVKGYKASQIVGRHYSIFFPPEDVRERRPWKILRNAARHGVWKEQSWRVRSDGTRFLADATLTAIRDKKGALLGYVKVTRDITESKRAEEADALRKREELQREFVANVSHELRTPLASIKGYAETLLRGALDDPKHARGFLETIEKHADLLEHLVEELLELSRLESGRIRGQRKRLSLAAVAARAVQAVQAKAAARRVHVTVKVPRGLRVQFPATQIAQVLTNLLDNAVKYNRRGGYVTIKAWAEKGEAILSVQDSGVGIPRAELSRIFDRFHRGKQHRANGVAGAGLGLAIVRAILEHHGCRIWADSAPGKGSTFFCTLPLAK